jgi:STE24 endopeptidase
MKQGTADARAAKERAKAYNKKKIILMIADMAIQLLLLNIIAFSGVSAWAVDCIRTIIAGDYLLFLVFLALMGICMSAASLPIDFYASYVVEHRYELSNQTVPAWILERLKSTGLSLALGIPVALAFYYFLKMSGPLWWLYFSSLLFIIAVLLARLAPVLIFPVFYRFRPLSDPSVEEKIRRVLDASRIRIKGIYSFNMSKDTRKANAGFAGMGRSRRIILSDTLLEGFTPDEIAVVFAHEAGHYMKRHIAKNVFLGGAIIYVSLFLCGTLYEATITRMGFPQTAEIAALPVLFLYLSVFGVLAMPATNAVSRRYEREADRLALELTGDTGSFISAMEKLASQNLSEREPHPLVEFFLYSHPAISRRIDFARTWKG